MPSVQEEKKPSAADIGMKLRQARENKGLSLEQAQKQTRIHSTVLKAIEEGRCDDILTPNYVKSFLKEYAAYLGFEHQQIVREYLALHPELGTKNVNLSAGLMEQRRAMDLARFIRIARSLVTFLIVVFLAVFISSKTIAFFKNSKMIKKAAVSRYSKPAGHVSANAQARKVQAVKNGPFTMKLKVKNPVMVQLKKDGVLLFKRVLPKGTEETFTANSSITMFVGRAEAVEIIVNGRSLGSPGRGFIRDLEVTSGGIRIK